MSVILVSLLGATTSWASGEGIVPTKEETICLSTSHPKHDNREEGFMPESTRFLFETIGEGLYRTCWGNTAQGEFFSSVDRGSGPEAMTWVSWYTEKKLAISIRVDRNGTDVSCTQYVSMRAKGGPQPTFAMSGPRRSGYLEESFCRSAFRALPSERQTALQTVVSAFRAVDAAGESEEAWAARYASTKAIREQLRKIEPARR